ncbi:MULTISPECIES: helix-turn-helix domain-containing protein [unclassified Sphingomonas]|uniref:helix-turn-helix domain-containing protein n=1 Tax=unclassified Sphingomonas TaxID=196159 RepID=UPI00226B72BE|nr:MULTISPECIES: helix-turn-helix domain-containing protein [unclassified Sphingomonas]
MTAFTLGQAAGMALGQIGSQLKGTAAPARPRSARSGAPHPTGAPVRRGSIEAGTFEEAFFAVPAKGETDRLLRIAQRTLDAARRLRREARDGSRVLTAAEQAIATLSAGAVRVYEEILTLARLNRGQVFPSYDHLAEATALGRATVARALRVLEAIGFLIRQRRFKRVETEGPGPRNKQTSNVYRPTLPQCVLAYLPRWMRPAPVPCDQVQRDADRGEDQAAMLASLSCRELAKVTVGGALGAMLVRLGAGIDRLESESHSHPQPLTEFNNRGIKRGDLAGRHA